MEFENSDLENSEFENKEFENLQFENSDLENMESENMGFENIFVFPVYRWSSDFLTPDYKGLVMGWYWLDIYWYAWWQKPDGENKARDIQVLECCDGFHTVYNRGGGRIWQPLPPHTWLSNASSRFG